MERTKKRTFQIDGDYLDVLFHYDEDCEMYLGKYPDFEESPRYTPAGRKWVNVTTIGCPYADEKYDDCGSCKYMRREMPMDLIGVCHNSVYQKKEKEYNMEA